jgi:alpha-L-arabinofuranosidase
MRPPDSSCLPVLAVALAVALPSLTWARADQATLTVRVDRPGARISPLLYGIFFEEINHAGDGGIYGELVRNRSFEDAATPEGWSLIRRGGAEAESSLDAERPLNAASPHSLRLEIRNPGSGEAGVANSGFWGIPVRKGSAYNLSLFARCSDGFGGGLSVRLEDAGGRRYAETRIKGLAPEWRQFTAALRANGTDSAARLVVAAASPGTVWLDVVSLFPADTWKERRNGLRPDLAELVQQMRPAFFRFPGGCFCEGDRIANAFRWKKSIGPVEERPGHWNLWGYRSSDGLGFHEYLQWCEDLGAEPLFVINCGMAHRDMVPLDRLDEWVQDALDAIEYANGPATSTWGARRANNSHPRPFGLKYLEIGNENGWGATLPAYEERYARFYDAIKQRYPQIQLIANTPVKSRPVDLLDEHFYNSPEWFAANAGRYDHRDRSGPRIYLGEYAVTQKCGQGNLRAALAEAAFMTGLERNADLVTMASYAPLFVNVRDRKWNPDAIGFDSAASYGTPSYYVQRMFAGSRGDVALPAEVEGTALPAPPSPGAVGLGTWRTQAEFTDARVTRGGETLLASDFGRGATGWRVVRGDWKTQDGSYRQTGVAEDLRSVAGDAAWTDYTYTLKARKLGGAEGFLVMFRARDDANWYWWNVGGWNNSQHAIERSEAGAKRIIGEPVPGRIETGRWYDIRIQLEGPRIRCYLDGKLVHDVEERPQPSLVAGASRVDRTGEIILKVVNLGGEPRATQVRLEGLRNSRLAGRALVLSGRPEDENSLAQPNRVAPAATEIRVSGPVFARTFPAHSVTVLTLR